GEQIFGHLPGGREREPTYAQLAVNADADFHLVLGQVERGLADGGYHARGQGDSHAPATVGDLRSDPGDPGAAPAPLRPRPGDLPPQHRGPGAPPDRAFRAVRHGDVVIDDDRADLDARSAREFGGQPKVHDVTGIVLHDVQHASPAVDALGRLED